MAQDTTLSSGVNWFQMARMEDFNDGKYYTRCVNEYLSPLASMEEEVSKEEAAIKADENLSDLGRAKKVKELGDRTLGKMADKLRVEAEGYERGINSHYKELFEREPLPDNTDARSAIREQEIRQHFMNKSVSEILQTLRDAEENGDYETIRALESAPRSLAPGPHEQIQKMKIERLKRKYPDEMAKIGDMKASAEKLRTILDSIEGRLKQIR